jgi:hypothetical protein
MSDTTSVCCICTLLICKTGTADAAANARCAVLLDQAGSELRGRAVYAQARPFRKRALTMSEKVLGAEHPGKAEAVNDLACLF